MKDYTSDWAFCQGRAAVCQRVLYGEEQLPEGYFGRANRVLTIPLVFLSIHRSQLIRHSIYCMSRSVARAALFSPLQDLGHTRLEEQ